MDKDYFKYIINEYNLQQDRICALNKIFPGSFAIIEYGNKLFNELLCAYFTMEGVDWITWYLYEKGGNSELKAFDENKNEIPTETIDDIWELVKDHVK